MHMIHYQIEKNEQSMTKNINNIFNNPTQKRQIKTTQNQIQTTNDLNNRHQEIENIKKMRRQNQK